jgi:hypothetical protein
VSVSPDDFAEIIKLETVNLSFVKLDPVVYEQVRLAAVDSFSQVIDELRHEFGDVAPSELVSHFGNDTTTTLLAAIADEYVICSSMSIVDPTVFVKPVATLIDADVNDFGVGVNRSPELVRVSKTVEEVLLVKLPP